MNIVTISPYIALILSGFAALVYQATWGRMLQRVFGVSDLAIATVLAAFFLGLGIGSALGGRWGKKTTRPARTYFILEIGIGVYALASLLILPNVHLLYGWMPQDASFFMLTSVRLVIALLILLPPTILMGATLPVLITLVARREGGWSAPATWLYATNTIGATLGAGATGLYLVPQFGARATILVAAIGSIIAAFLIGWAYRGTQGLQEADAPGPEDSDQETSTAEIPTASEAGAVGRSNMPALAITLAGMAGLASLASEVLWTRVLRLILQGTTQAFSVMLVNYLLGIAVGSLIAERLLRKGRSPLRLFAWSQVALAVLSILAMGVAAHLPRVIGLLHGRADLSPHEPGVILAVSAILLLPLALALGMSVPLAWKIAEGKVTDAPKHAGRVLASNTLGGLIGSLLTGFLLVQYLGVEASILVIVFIHLITAGVAFRYSVSASLVPRVIAMTAPLALGALLIQTEPSLELRFLLDARRDATTAIIEGPGERWEEPVVFLEEGRNTTVTILRVGPTLRLYNDGRPESGFSPDELGFGSELVILGSLPNLFSAHFDRAMVVGLGAGHSTAVLLEGPWREVEVVELEGGVVDAARNLYEAKERAFPLDDPRARIIVDDARARLVLAEPDSYDAIVSQPSHPWLAGSSALYTQEFFRECRTALRPGGVLAIWVNLFRIQVPQIRSVIATLAQEFPHVTGLIVEESSLILGASEQPFDFGEQLRDRVNTHREFLGHIDIDTYSQYMTTVELDDAAARAFASGAPVIEDDRPLLEFVLGQTASDVWVSNADLDYAWRELPWLSSQTWGEVPDDLRANTLLDRVAAVASRRRALGRVELLTRQESLTPTVDAVVAGAMAEARGNVNGALEAYDRGGNPDSAWRADALRLDERMFWSLIQSARARSETASEPTPLLRAALAVGNQGAMRDALRIGAEGGETRADNLRSLTRALLSEESCAAVVALEESVLDDLTNDEFAAFQIERCAFLEGDEAMARRFGEERMRARRITAVSEGRSGDEALSRQNLGLAARHFRRALAANPGHGSAAAQLARILNEENRRDEAIAVVRAAAHAARGLPGSTSNLRAVAADLGISLGDDAESESQNSSSNAAP